MANSKALLDKNKLVEEIKKEFDEETVSRISKETKFVQRKSKLSAMDFLILCVFAHQKNENISLEGLSAELMQTGVCITKQSLQERFNDQASSFIEKMLGDLLLQKLHFPAIVPHRVFGRIIIGDSTVFQLPESFASRYRGSGGGASNAAIKIQYSYDLLSHSLHAMLVEEGIKPDVNMDLGEVKKTIYG
jgi:hypothetical protein